MKEAAYGKQRAVQRVIRIMSIQRKFLHFIKYSFRSVGVEISWHKENVTVEESDNSRRNYDVDMAELQEALVHHLCSHGCWIRTVFSENECIQKICFKYADRHHIYRCAEDFSLGDIKIKLNPSELKNPHRKLRPFYFTDGWQILGSNTYAFDPWLRDDERIYSNTPNNLVSSVPNLFQERTPWAAAPYFLQGAENFDVDYKNSLDIPESADNICNFPIDIVITWVDGNDESWREKRYAEKYITTGLHPDSASDARYRNRDELRHCLRSVHYFAKFARNIFLVTDDQVPVWLDTADERITVVSHRDIFPDQSHLPVFNSHAIEANLHRIDGLSENFVYLNDDVFLWNKCRPVDFFDFAGNANVQFEELPNVYGEPLASVPVWRTAALNVNNLISKRFGSTIYRPHLHIPFSMKKSLMQQIWKEFPDAMETVSSTSFRSNQDVSPASFFHPVFAYMIGQARIGSARSIRTSLGRKDFQPTVEKLLFNPSIKFLCINDDNNDTAVENDVPFRNLMRRKFSSPAPWEKDK